MAVQSKFEGMDHQVLADMVGGTDPATVLSRAAKLQQAGGVLKELGEALKSHLSKVTWEGQAAENFKTWAGNLQQSAEKLGAYSAGAGDAMNQAGEALSTAKAAMPKVPTEALGWVNGRVKQGAPDPDVVRQLKTVGWNPNGPSTADIDAAMKRKNPDWVSETQAMAGTKEVYDAHQEAIRQMEKLGEAYAAATTTLNGLGDNVVLPGTPETSRDTASDYSGGGTTGGSYRGTLPGPRSSGGSVKGSYNSPGGNYGGVSMTPRDPAAGRQESTYPGHTGPVPPHSGGQLPPPPQDPGTPAPPSHPSDPVTRPGTGLDSIPTLPDQTTPVGPGGGPVLPSGPGGTQGYPGGPDGRGGLPGVPGSGPISGFPAGTGGGSVPTKGIGSIPGKGGGSVPLRTGPFNGGSTPGKAGTPGLPSGTVFGREGAPGGGRVGGSPMGGGMGGMHPGMGGGHGVVGGSGGSRGRGLTSTPGGTVGGRKGPAAGGEFTPGGTGLRNRAAAGAAEGGARSGQNGMMAPGAGGHGGKKERDRRDRADYLHEDEETWISGTPHSNPDVIE
ncbi:WXG100 family type VII secretion target [Kitasatospora sp. NPDC028055]|uniref:WXG100 family type VII secretion target n=1 Tax=Kitasatospora sp. NPDC028055 TaxID=3155653 RepID=UPI0033F1E41C